MLFMLLLRCSAHATAVSLAPLGPRREPIRGRRFPLLDSERHRAESLSAQSRAEVREVESRRSVGAVGFGGHVSKPRCDVELAEKEMEHAMP